LKLLSSQGQGVYDPGAGVWSVGTLDKNGNATIELVLQSVNDGYFVNTVNFYGDLASINTFNSKNMVRSLSVGSASGNYDPDNGNNQANFNFNSINPSAPGDNGNNYDYEFPRDVQPPDDPKVPPTQPKPHETQPPNHNPPNKPSKPTTQLGRDIAGVRDALSDGNLNKPLPNWNLTLNNGPEEHAEDPPWWIYAMVVIGALIGAALVITPAGEYLQRIINGILASLSSFWLYLSYLGYAMKKFLEDAILRILVQCGIYITPILQELYSVPITGIGPTTIIGIGLRSLVIKYPWLEEYVAPVFDILDQLTYQEISQKVKEFFNK